MTDCVSNTSPLIILAKARLLELLPTFFSRVLIPQAVLDEIASGPENDPIRQLLPKYPWLVPVRVEPELSPLSTWAIDRGEAEVIEYARLNRMLPVLLDDRRARRVAERLGLRVHGTIGIAAAAAQRNNSLELFRSFVVALRSAGIYVSDEIVRAIEKEFEPRG
jgi:uncharacterized protein